MYSIGRMALSNADEPLGPQNVGSSWIMSPPWQHLRVVATCLMRGRYG